MTGTPIPWEQRRQLGFLKALGLTFRAVLLRPQDFYGTLVKGYQIKDGVLFFLLIQMIWVVLVLAGFALFRPEGLHVGRVLGAVVFPLVSLVSLLAGAGLWHLFISLFKGEGGYKATVMILCYSAVTHLFGLVPYAGMLANLIWGGVVNVIGSMKMHRLSRTRAILAYLIPGLLVVAVFIGLVLLALHNLRSFG